MTLVSSFLDLVRQLACVMSAPTFGTFVTVLTGWVFACGHTVTGAILAADAVGTKHYSSFHRLFAKAEWRLKVPRLRWSHSWIVLSVVARFPFCAEPQGWTHLAVERTAPTAMPPHTLIVLRFARSGHRHYRQLGRPRRTRRSVKRSATQRPKRPKKHKRNRNAYGSVRTIRQDTVPYVAAHGPVLATARKSAGYG